MIASTPAWVWPVFVVLAYIIGTFPSAVLVARAKGVDITAVGSGNPGASNIARTFGTAWGVLVFVLDGAKGALPALIGLMVNNRALAWAMVAAAVMGHMFPASRSFRGGKGVATMGGACFAMQPLVALGMLALWGAVRKLSGTASLASISIIVGFPIACAIRGVPAWELVTILAIAALVLARHAGNIQRLVGGHELSASRSRQ